METRGLVGSVGVPGLMAGRRQWAEGMMFADLLMGRGLGSLPQYNRGWCSHLRHWKS